MKKTKAIIERASDGNFSIYMDDDSMPFLITGTGATVEEARRIFDAGYEDMKALFISEGKDFEDLEFTFQYDTASFLQYYAFAFSLAGLERITGVNQKQLGHYISGYRNPSQKTKQKIEESIQKFCKELSGVSLA